MAKTTDKPKVQRKRYDRDQVVADWQTGSMTIRDVAYKHKISGAMVYKLIAGQERVIENLVNKELEIKQELAKLNKNQVETFEREVNNKFKAIEFLNHAALKNVEEAMAVECTNQFEFKARADTINRAKEVVIGKTPDTAVQVNNGTVITQISRTIV